MKSAARERERKRAGLRALEAFVLNVVAGRARESLTDEADAFSAFLSEIAGSDYLSKMEAAKVVRVPGTRRKGRRA